MITNQSFTGLYCTGMKVCGLPLGVKQRESSSAFK